MTWFTDRIGQRVYRNKGDCRCPTCLDVEANGLVIRDEDHAAYLQSIQAEFIADGLNLNYRDTV